MKAKRERELIKTIFIIGAILISLVFSISSHVKQGQKLEQIERQYLTTTETLDETNMIVSALTEGNATLAEQLEAERAERQVAEQNFADSQKTIAAVQADVANQRETLAAADITNLIKNWSSRVVRVTCDVKISGITHRLKASGVVSFAGVGTEVYTSKHVVEKDGVIAEDCRIEAADETTSFSSKLILVDVSKDLAYIKFNQTISLLGAGTPVKKCLVPPTIGDQVVILGYPSVGAREGITATDGIISGFDKPYYITSAKIERGNSGGAAIHVKNNCLLGLPTLVVAGQVESLARILAL